MNIKTVIFLIIVTGFGAACSKMNDQHEQYLENGEIPYTAKFDSVKVYSGINRVKIEYGLSDPKAKKACFYWNLRADSLIVDVDISADDTPTVFYIDDVPEGVISFEIFTYDAGMSNRSAILTTTGVVVYGDKYRSTLNNRTVKSTAFNSLNDSLSINWVGSFDDAVMLQLKYLTKDGETVETEFPVSTTTSKLADFMIESSFDFRMMYVPVSCLDTFYTEYASHFVEMPVPEVVFPETAELGKSITLTGSNLNMITEVWFGTLQGNITEKDFASMTVSLPPSEDTGEVDLRIVYGGGKELNAGIIDLILIQPKFALPLGGEIGKSFTITGNDLDIITEVWFGPLPGEIAAGGTAESQTITVPASAAAGDVEVKVMYGGGLEMIAGTFYQFVKDPNLARYAGSDYPDAPALIGKNPSWNASGGRRPAFALDGCDATENYLGTDFYTRWYSKVGAPPNVARTYWQGNSGDSWGEIPNGTAAPNNHVCFTLNYSDTRAGSVTFDKIRLSARNKGEIAQYTIEFSDDNLNWTKAVRAEDTSPLPGSGTEYVEHQLPATVTAKYVRFVCVVSTSTSSNGGNVGLTEFQLYNTTVAP